MSGSHFRISVIIHKTNIPFIGIACVFPYLAELNHLVLDNINANFNLKIIVKCKYP